MKFLQGWWHYARDPRIFGSALALALVGVAAWLIAPANDKLFNFLLLFSALGALTVTTLNIWISRWESQRKPLILIGVGDPESLTCRLSPKWQSESERVLCDPVSIRVAMRNAGNRTAGQVLYNVVLPKAIRNAMTSFFGGGIQQAKSNEGNVLRYVYTRRDLLPGPVDLQEIQLAFLRGSRDYEGYFIVYVDEQPGYQRRFVLEVRDQQTSLEESVIEVVRVADNE